MLKDYPQSLANANIFGQGNLYLVSEKSGKSQGILLSIICGNPAQHIEQKQNYDGRTDGRNDRQPISNIAPLFQSRPIIKMFLAIKLKIQ